MKFLLQETTSLLCLACFLGGFYKGVYVNAKKSQYSGVHEVPLHLPTTTTFFSRLLSSEGLRLSCEGLLKAVFSWFLSASVNDRAFPLSDVTLSLVSVLSR